MIKLPMYWKKLTIIFFFVLLFSFAIDIRVSQMDSHFSEPLPIITLSDVAVLYIKGKKENLVTCSEMYQYCFFFFIITVQQCQRPPVFQKQQVFSWFVPILYGAAHLLHAVPLRTPNYREANNRYEDDIDHIFAGHGSNGNSCSCVFTSDYMLNGQDLVSSPICRQSHNQLIIWCHV